ncbi:hypothetical protein TSAR_001692 [Trichomalopsis sarcophagae]|uniref:Ionotropic receptor 75a N-terminal domain-containing protein n=1 Tax=Trichomalopsis sarcophagae TaxID=543379 RepID=A0A232EGC2_9HYME|nr:hypothetical protein TSAR_001692 [Trichomalopsis sarcophagae]
MFGELHYWVILGSDLKNLFELIDDRAFGLGTDLIAVVPLNDTEDRYELYDVYSISKERGIPMKVTLFGIWNNQEGLNITLLQTKFERRSNLERLIIKATYFKLIYRPDNMSLEDYFNDYENSVGDAITKFGFQLISHLADLYNFSTSLRSGAKRRVKLNHLSQEYPQTAKILKSRLFVTKVVLICTMGLAHERTYNEFGKLHMKMASEAMVYLEFFLKYYFPYEIPSFLKLPENEKLMNPDKGMQLVEEGGLAYHMHPVVCYPIIDKLFDNREICELMEVHVARPTRTAFGATMNSSFVEIARVGFTKINEVGLRHRQYLKWSHLKRPCRKDILSAASINIYEFSPYLLLLAVEIMMSTTLCLIEVILVNHGMCINIRNIVCTEHVSVSYRSFKPRDRRTNESRSFESFLQKPDWESQIFYQIYCLKLPESEQYRLPEVGMQLVQKGGYAYHTHPDVGYRLIHKYYTSNARFAS